MSERIHAFGEEGELSEGAQLAFDQFMSGTVNPAISDAVSGGGGGGTTDHTALTNRDASDQHPISAITGLQTTLNDKADAGHNHDGVYVKPDDLPAPGAKVYSSWAEVDAETEAGVGVLVTADVPSPIPAQQYGPISVIVTTYVQPEVSGRDLVALQTAEMVDLWGDYKKYLICRDVWGDGSWSAWQHVTLNTVAAFPPEIAKDIARKNEAVKVLTTAEFNSPALSFVYPHAAYTANWSTLTGLPGLSTQYVRAHVTFAGTTSAGAGAFFQQRVTIPIKDSHYPKIISRLADQNLTAWGPWVDTGGGTGFPEGVVTAPVGTEYVDTAATNGAIKWIKASGTGNTGWKVLYGDTGFRSLKDEVIAAGWGSFLSSLRLRRNGPFVSIIGRLNLNLNGTTFDGFELLASAGFDPPGPVDMAVRPHASLPDGVSVSFANQWIEVRSLAAFPDMMSDIRFSGSWFTDDPWPTTLPGIPA